MPRGSAQSSHSTQQGRLEPESSLAEVAFPSESASTFTADRDVAVIVVHGMGQQVRFETLEQVAGLLHRALQTKDPVVLRRVRLQEEELTRAELTSVENAEGATHAIHLYELYWAPLTEGKVGLRDVFIFLWNAAWAGLRFAANRVFDRWMFGKWQCFRLNLSSAFAFFAALGVISSLAVMNAVMGAVIAAWLGGVLGGSRSWPSPSLVTDLTTDLALFLLVVLLCLAVGIGLPAILRTRRAPVPMAVSWFAWRFVWLAVLATVAVGAMVAYHLWFHREGGAQLFWETGWLKWMAVDFYDKLKPLGFLRLGLVWGASLYVSLKVRTLLVQYVGDVAAYVSGHKVSKFEELREQIRGATCKVARAVYEAPGKAAGSFAYERVVVVGHSLGSVIAYDVLNALTRRDLLAEHRSYPAERTALFLTFGSPLDKTAFIFRSQAGARLDVREAAVATVQPMIESYAFRPRKWVNLFTPNDWIGGSLEYYDDPMDPLFPVRGVKNEEDLEATTPLAAHSEHWNGASLAGHLTRAVR